MTKPTSSMTRREFTRTAALAVGALGSAELLRGDEAQVKVGLYSITYLGVWYRGDALTLEQVVDRAQQYAYEGVEIDGKQGGVAEGARGVLAGGDVGLVPRGARGVGAARGRVRCHPRPPEPRAGDRRLQGRPPDGARGRTTGASTRRGSAGSR